MIDSSPNRTSSRTRWLILILAGLTNTLGVAVASMCMPVLFNEISAELHLDLVQVGLIWGISSLPGIFTALLGGVIGDRFGPRRILIAACLLVGAAGALRGLTHDFYGLAGSMFLLGALTPMISMNTIKTCGLWFSRRQLGLASGVLSMGMALGFMLASLVSATYLSPALGGWRGVLFLYGGLAAALALPWRLVPNPPGSAAAQPASTTTLRRNLAAMARIPNLWLLGLALLGVSGCVQGALGYIPLYLRGQGWAPASADGALASFHTISMICVIPIALLSDRLRTRKKILIIAALMLAGGIGLLSAVSGPLVWPAVLLAGMVRDGFMAVFITAIIETEGVGPAYAGTATGMVMIFSGLGNLLAPPIGNSLAAAAPGLPFLFWAGLLLVGFSGLLASKERAVLTQVVAE